MNYIRNVSFTVKRDKAEEFTTLLTTDVLPTMKAQPGFKHELAMINGQHAVGLSVWTDKASAEKYQAAVYPQLLKKLSLCLEGTPEVTHYDLAVSTLAV
ncbi:MAG TPA: antibiotic biosynthesis monooxygenase [Gemmatimonadales bacterium]|nr:antibiotic biosynthesis monooxygenase [Gemmatimonadales bacterium]